MTLTKIFEIQAIQSVLIKFWYLGLTSPELIAYEDVQTLKPLLKNVVFANCFTFELPLKTYCNFMEFIMAALDQLKPLKIFHILLSQMKANKINSISYELFGVTILQLFGKVLKHLDTTRICQILRQVFFHLTHTGSSGKAQLKLTIKQVEPVPLEKYITNIDKIIE